MMGNLGNLMRQAQEAQKKVEAMKEELAEKRLTSTAGGLVTCVVDGLGEVVEVTIDGAKIGLDPEDAELLQDAILAAIHDGAAQAQEQSAKLMQQLTGGLKLPPGFGF